MRVRWDCGWTGCAALGGLRFWAEKGWVSGSFYVALVAIWRGFVVRQHASRTTREERASHDMRRACFARHAKSVLRTTHRCSQPQEYRLSGSDQWRRRGDPLRCSRNTASSLTSRLSKGTLKNQTMSVPLGARCRTFATAGPEVFCCFFQKSRPCFLGGVGRQRCEPNLGAHEQGGSAAFVRRQSGAMMSASRSVVPGMRSRWGDRMPP